MGQQAGHAQMRETAEVTGTQTVLRDAQPCAVKVKRLGAMHAGTP